MNNKSIIKLILHEHPWEILQARIDHARVTNQPLYESPFWFENTETGRCYHALYSCIGWPTEVQESKDEQPGYVAIVGVIRPTKELEHYNPVNANFLLLNEFQSKDVGTLLDKAVEMREKYGYGVQPELLKVFYGDPDRFLTTVALYNERLAKKYGNENSAILITPPVDFYDTMVFDNYIRSLRSCLLPDKTRFFFGGNDILKNNLREFKKENPAVMAIGGLVHSLLTVCTWMNNVGENMFAVEEKAA